MSVKKYVLALIVLTSISLKCVIQVPIAPLPEAKSLIEKHLAALGGKKKLLGLRSRHFKAKITTISGNIMEGSMEIHFARIRVKDKKTEKMVTRSSFRFVLSQGGDETIIASDGLLTWQRQTPAQGSQTFQLLSRAQAAMFLNMFDPSGFARYEKTHKSWRTLRKALINGARAYEVAMVTKEGLKEHYFFSTSSGLLVAMKSFLDFPTGIQVSKTSFSDYRKVSGILTPFAATGEGVGFKQVSATLPGGGYNAKMDASLFAPPLDVLRLKKEKPVPKGGTKNKKRS